MQKLKNFTFAHTKLLLFINITKLIKLGQLLIFNNLLHYLMFRSIIIS